jgi:deoxyribodipyrimidine photo-lyase
MGAELVTFKDSVLFEGPEILSRSGSPYRVFTPYKNAWLGRAADLPRRLPPLRSIVSPPEGRGDSSLDRFPGFAGLETGQGETIALRILKTFAIGAALIYRQNRDFPGTGGTSKLSPYLANGAVSIRTVFWTLQDARAGATKSERNSIDAYVGELIWREFYYQIIQHFPFVLQRAFRDELNDIEWVNDPVRFDAWRKGRTGYPIVDAAMRQLNSEGWMHNRARMIVASFLTKDLHINWKWGEKYFLEMLIDADLASNNGGWQWTAGTGTDASPWFRIFNPILQGKKFDPEGEYVRRYVHELAHVPTGKIHKPWTLTGEEQKKSGCIPGRTYPWPIVDHSEARGTTLRLYGTPASRRKGSRTAAKEPT